MAKCIEIVNKQLKLRKQQWQQPRKEVRKNPRVDFVDIKGIIKDYY